MSNGEMQACLARLYVDTPFRRLFYLDPATLREYRLTDEEFESIRRIDRDKLELFALSLSHKRRRRIERAYPLLFRLDAAEIGRYWARYYQLYPAKPHHTGHQDALDFGTFMEESLVDATHLPWFACDLARYERLSYFAKFIRVPGAAEATLSDAENAARAIAMDARPRLGSGVVLADFGSDVVEVEAAMLRGESPDALDPEHVACSILFRPGASAASIKILRVNPPTHAVVDLCDGYRTVDRIVASVETELGAPDLARGVVDVIARLVSLRVLTLAAGAEPTTSLRGFGASLTEAI